MRDEERTVEVECQACRGSGYLCECETAGVINRYLKSEGCEYCGSQRRDKHKYVCSYCDGRGVVEEVEHYAVEG